MSKAEQTFLAALHRADAASIGIVFVRSREPERALKAVRKFALVQERAFRSWSVVTGWTKPDPVTGADGIPDATVDLLQALKKVLDVPVPAANAKPFEENSVSFVSSPHPWLTMPDKVNPIVVALLQQYAWALSGEGGRRLVLSVPEAFQVPPELEHCIPVLDFDLPDAEELKALIKKQLDNEATARGGNPQKYTEAEFNVLAASAGGLTLLEAENAVCCALADFAGQLPRVPFDDFNMSIMAVKSEAVKAGGFMEVMKPVPIEEVGGLELFKEWLEHRIIDFTEEAQKDGVKRPRGVTLIGVPGGGKSLLATTVAGKLRVPAVAVNLGAIMGGIVGDTERNTRRMFAQIKALGRCVIFLDEIDRVMGMNTQGGDGGVTKRLVGAFLTFMNDSTSGAFFVFAANRAEGIDSALVRPGRIDRVFGVGCPNATERMQILHIKLRQAKKNPAEIKDLAAVVTGSAGYVGAELEAAVQLAASESYRTKQPVTGAMLLRHIQDIIPQSQSFAEDFAAMAAWAKKNAYPASLPDKEAAVKATAAQPARERNRVVRAPSNN